MSSQDHFTIGTVYKPRRQVRGRGVAQMSTLLNKSYLVKVSTKGRGGSKMPQILSTWFVHCPWGYLIVAHCGFGLILIKSNE